MNPVKLEIPGDVATRSEATDIACLRVKMQPLPVTSFICDTVGDRLWIAIGVATFSKSDPLCCVCIPLQSGEMGTVPSLDAWALFEMVSTRAGRQICSRRSLGLQCLFTLAKRSSLQVF